LERNLRYVQSAKAHTGMNLALETERLKKRKNRRRARESDFKNSSGDFRRGHKVAGSVHYT
jgi:hypothetical protein